MGSVDRNSKKESKRKSRIQEKNCHRNEENTGGLISRWDAAEEGLSELEGMTTETSNGHSNTRGDPAINMSIITPEQEKLSSMKRGITQW